MKILGKIMFRYIYISVHFSLEKVEVEQLPPIQEIGDLHPLMRISNFGIKGRLISNPQIRTCSKTKEAFLPVTLWDRSGKIRVVFQGQKAIEFVYILELFSIFIM